LFFDTWINPVNGNILNKERESEEGGYINPGMTFHAPSPKP
jgi:hypothetical protein